MRLERRVRYILLPFTIIVFSFGGGASYLALKEHRYVQYQQLIQHDLKAMHNEVQFEIRNAESLLSEILNSSEFVRFSNEQDAKYRAFSLGAPTYEMVERVTSGSNVASLHITNQDGEILLSYDDQDPFDTPSLPTLPNQLVGSIFEHLQNAPQFSQIGFFFKAHNGQLNYALARSFSPHLLEYDRLNNSQESYLIALMTLSIEGIDHYRQEMQEELGHDLQFDVALKDAPYQINRSQFSLYVDNAGDIQTKINTSSYTVSAIISNNNVSTSLRQSKTQLIVLTLLMSIITYFALWRAIKRLIVRPINELATRVKQTSDSDKIELELMHGNDEVSELNNAYYQLLENVQHIASFDALTGLANRASFEVWLERHVSRQLNKSTQIALLFIDLDKFKWVNDHYGHAVGDQLLRQFGARLREITRTSDITTLVSQKSIARLAGDEFAIVLSDISGPEAAKSVAKRVIKLFESGFEVEGIAHDVQASIGIAMLPNDSHDASTLLQHADVAMYQAKAKGRNRFEFFTQAIADDMRQRDFVEREIKNALNNKSFELVYMPIVELQTGKIIGCEALIRCPALQQRGIGPDQFIPIAESTGLIKKIDLRVIEQAFIDYIQLQQFGFGGYMAINISAVELRNEYFAEQLAKLLIKHQVSPSNIHLELTETRLIAPDAGAVSILEQLNELGFELILDDFGTGYTAFNQLVHYPVSGIKIDRSFIGAVDDKYKVKMVEIILALAAVYELDIVAEGVETKEQASFLTEQGCRFGQGYYFSKPIPIEQLFEMIEDSN